MNTEIRTDDAATIFTLLEPELGKKISSALKAEFLIQCPLDGDFIVDLSRVKTCDSDGLSALLVVHRELQAGDRMLKIVGANAKIMREIHAAELHNAFAFFSTIKEARATGKTKKVAVPAKPKKAAPKKSVAKTSKAAPAAKSRVSRPSKGKSVSAKSVKRGK